ncbi:hypothetical protein BW28_05790 [Clostridioides difficile]|nr:hypothetical protein BW28_05790 [Clostridioides difficile]
MIALCSAVPVKVTAVRCIADGSAKPSATLAAEDFPVEQVSWTLALRLYFLRLDRLWRHLPLSDLAAIKLHLNTAVRKRGDLLNIPLERFFIESVRFHQFGANIHQLMFRIIVALAGDSRLFFAAADPVHIFLAPDPAFLPRKVRPAYGAFELSRKAICRIQQRSPSLHFRFYLCVGVAVDDSLVAVCHVILRQLSAIWHLPFGDGIFDVAFLSADIPGIDLVENQLPY